MGSPVALPTSAHQHAWLQKISLHMWARLQCRWAWTTSISQACTTKSPENRRQIISNLVRTLLAVGEALAQKPPVRYPQRFRANGFVIRAWHYSFIVSSVAALPAEWIADLTEDQLLQVIRFGKLALEHYEMWSDKALPANEAVGVRAQRRQRQRKYMYHAAHRATLATAYLRFNVGDISRNIDTAFEHYESAAKILKQENDPIFSLSLAGIWTTLGTALLNYPTENRGGCAERAVQAFQRANEILATHANRMETPRHFKRDWKRSAEIAFITRWEFAEGSHKPRALEEWRMFWGGVPDAFVSGAIIPFYKAWVDWQLGIAWQYLGQPEKAIEQFDSALGTCPDNADARAAIHLSKGLACLELPSGNRVSNLKLAIDSFKNIYALKSRLRSERIIALALLEDVRASLDFVLGVVPPEERKEPLTIATKQLRAAARIARTIAAAQLLQEILFTLGKVYAELRDSTKAYQTLTLAARVADRLERRVRTPRLGHFLVGTRAPLDDLLLRITFSHRKFSREMTEQGKKMKAPSLESIFCSAERGRTVFLQSQLASLNVLPKGASEIELRKLFGQRREWHEAELRLLERESIPAADDKVLIELGEQRNILESRYHGELESVREKFNDSDYDPDKPMASIRSVELESVIFRYLQEKRAALVEYFLTSLYPVVFVLLPTQIGYEFVKISIEDLEAISVRWQEGFERPRSSKHWEQGYLLQILNRLRPIAEVPAQTIEAWERKTGQRIERIIVVPHRFLHLIPLHAIEVREGKMWGDLAPIQYVPSTSVLLQLLKSKPERSEQSVDYSVSNNGRTTVAISSLESPASNGERHSLVFNAEEARAVADTMNGVLLSGPEATPGRVIREIEPATHIHFASHAKFVADEPLKAGLELALETGPAASGAPDKGRWLTLGEIFRRVRLPHGPLVVLSACETGLSKVEKRHEEYIGLPAGFLYAGAKTVVSTLWRIPDLAAWFLMQTFWNEIKTGSGPGEALRRASCTLRSLSLEQARELISAAASQEKDPAQREAMLKESEKLKENYPFASPYWWAGFTVNGLG